MCLNYTKQPEVLMFVCFSGIKLDILELSEKSQFPNHNCNLDVNVKGFFISPTLINAVTAT